MFFFVNKRSYTILWVNSRNLINEIYMRISEGLAIFIDQTYDIGGHKLTVILGQNTFVRKRTDFEHPQVVFALAFTATRTEDDYSWIAQKLAEASHEMTGKLV